LVPITLRATAEALVSDPWPTAIAKIRYMGVSPV
jgi:hypothetical protein